MDLLEDYCSMAVFESKVIFPHKFPHDSASSEYFVSNHDICWNLDEAEILLFHFANQILAARS